MQQQDAAHILQRARVTVQKTCNGKNKVHHRETAEQGREQGGKPQHDEHHKNKFVREWYGNPGAPGSILFCTHRSIRQKVQKTVSQYDGNGGIHGCSRLPFSGLLYINPLRHPVQDGGWNARTHRPPSSFLVAFQFVQSILKPI